MPAPEQITIDHGPASVTLHGHELRATAIYEGVFDHDADPDIPNGTSRLLRLYEVTCHTCLLGPRYKAHASRVASFALNITDNTWMRSHRPYDPRTGHGDPDNLDFIDLVLRHCLNDDIDGYLTRRLRSVDRHAHDAARVLLALGNSPWDTLDGLATKATVTTYTSRA